MMRKVYSLIFFCGLLLALGIVLAQQPRPSKTALKELLTEEKFEAAGKLWLQQVNALKAEKKYDSLPEYVSFLGKIKRGMHGSDSAIRAMNDFLEELRTLTSQPRILGNAYDWAADFIGQEGRSKTAYELSQTAYIFLEDARATPKELSVIERNMGTYAYRLGDMALSAYHHRRALAAALKEKEPDYEGLYFSYNGIGTICWFASKMDSTEYYFKKSLEAVQKADSTPLNQYYRPALIQNNLAGVYSLQGKTTESMGMLRDCIGMLKKFIADPAPDPKKNAAHTLQCEAMDNLAGIYREWGDVRQARQLLSLSYQKKKSVLEEGHVDIYKSEILLGQVFRQMMEYDSALHYLNSGLEGMRASEEGNSYWEADACNTLALLYDERGEETRAGYFYEQGDSLYEASLQGSYDHIYMEFLGNAALFYAENGVREKALEKARKVRQYTVQGFGEQSLQAFNSTIKLSEVYYASGMYPEAKTTGASALEMLNGLMVETPSLLDSIRMEAKKPKALLVFARAGYRLLEEKNKENLTDILIELKKAVAVLERRKIVLNDAENIRLMMADHSDLMDFMKKITHELYTVTGDEQYVDELVSLHESGIYQRIRARIDENDSIGFRGISPALLEEERTLKASIRSAFDEKDSYDTQMRNYFERTDAWNAFQNRLRKEEPEYFNMRYASILKPMPELQRQIPLNTTVVRYLFVEDDLFAFVVDANMKKLVPLDAKGLDQLVAQFTANTANPSGSSVHLHHLYNRLWAPLREWVKQTRLIIVPDGVLYNLSFETLTPQPIQHYSELAKNSLLADFPISYQYSLFAFNGQREKQEPEGNFVAFAPVFSEETKAIYHRTLKDSSEADEQYLSLPALPFTRDLALSTNAVMDGQAFINEASTEDCFRTNAGGNKIIHIGTHAESNDVQPNLSRLIFSKNTSDPGADNSLYLPEIYNCNLRSNLTILAACESGRSVRQPGEGMLSLAHAFSFAGSESILTGLWKIDEQASARLIGKFYDHLMRGMEKDEALRRAKLDYLAESRGRSTAPAYWSGLVLMGDTTPLELRDGYAWMYWVLGGSLLFMAAILFWRSGR